MHQVASQGLVLSIICSAQSRPRTACGQLCSPMGPVVSLLLPALTNQQPTVGSLLR